jgi:hypothetical protein
VGDLDGRSRGVHDTGLSRIVIRLVVRASVRPTTKHTSEGAREP